MPVTADDLDAAVSTMVTTLRPATGRDWSAPAGALEWDCWHTAEHLGDVLLSYAAQLVAQPTTGYVRFMANADTDAAPAEVLEFAEAGGRILAATVRTSPPQVRAYHPTGMADPEGFAGMGCVEALVHGHDIAQGLGLALDTPGEVCARVLARMFPHAVADLADLDPWMAVLWATAASPCPGARGLRTGAGTAPHRASTDEHCHRGTPVMGTAQTPARPCRRKPPNRNAHDLPLEYQAAAGKDSGGRDRDHHGGDRRGTRDRAAVEPEPCEVELDRLAHAPLDLVEAAAGGDTARQVRAPGRVGALLTFDDDRVPGHDPRPFSCACLRILARVPGSTSSRSFPATVTGPG